jgi:RHS repeat-associated protein
MINPPTGNITTFERGKKFFELSNHLGNVLVTISDKKIGVDENTDGTIDYYVADVVSATDNYVFGMTMPSRNFQSDKYRYGFNGQEKDYSICEGNYDFGDRIYDGRIGRWLSLDPLQKKYPGESHYAFVANSPLLFMDPDGRDRIVTLTIIDKDGKSSSTTTVYKGEYINYQKISKPGFGNSIYVKYDIIENTVIDYSKPKYTATYSVREGDRHEISPGDYVWHNIVSYFNSDNDRAVQTGGVTLTSEFSTNGGDAAKTDARKGSSAIWYVDGFVAAFTALGKSPEITSDLKELLLELQGKANEFVEKILDEKEKRELEEAKNKQTIPSSPTSSTANTKPSPSQNNSNQHSVMKPPPVVIRKPTKGNVTGWVSTRSSSDPNKPDTTIELYRPRISPSAKDKVLPDKKSF